MRVLTRALVAAFAAASAAGLPGCVVPLAAGAAAGYGTFEYVNGEMQYAVYAGVDKTVKAAAAVLKERGWNVTEYRHDATSGWFRCLTTDKTQVDIDVKYRSSEFTKVSVRYGAFGDELESKRLIEQVKAKL